MNSFSKSGSQRPPSSSSPSISFDSYKFDFGISSSNTSSSTRPLKDHHKLNPNSSSSSSSSSNPSSSSPAPKPSWTHQPTPPARSALPNPSPSMIGDIHGRSWSHSSSHIGIPAKNPNLFGDLLGSAIGLGRAPQNVPLKSAPINKAGPAIGSVTKPYVGSSSNSNNTDPFESLTGFGSKPSLSSVNGTGIGSFAAFQKPVKIPNTSPPTQPQRPVSGSGADSLDMFFSNSSSSAAPAPIPEMNDWDVGAEFGGDENGGTTIELEGLPPPPAGVTAASAKTKGLDNYKQGQFADAIKWLSWAFVLFEKSGQVASSNEVLVCRSSCYKEVGEYKKAIADCSKVLDHDRTNVSVLLQRALLYESSEKYRLGAEDLRAVLKTDPGNRLARSTIHRMNQFAE